MFRSRFIVKKAGELQSGVKNERDANGAEQRWQARDVGSLKREIVRKLVKKL